MSRQGVAALSFRNFLVDQPFRRFLLGQRQTCVSFIPVTPRNEATVWQGRRLAAGKLIVKDPEVGFHNQTSRDTTIRALLLSAQTFREAAGVLAGNARSIHINSWTAIRPSQERMCAFEQSLVLLLARAVAEPKILGSLNGRMLESACLRALVDAVVDPAADLTTRISASGRSKLIKRAVAFMREHLDQPLTALDLCAELGVSDRALRRAFRETFGSEPLDYFRIMRMHAVRAALRAAHGSGQPVADIVSRWGFGRLGSFAGEYRRQFGELPSETLGVRGWPGVQRMVSPDD